LHRLLFAGFHRRTGNQDEKRRPRAER
jgi:hypothetical protein